MTDLEPPPAITDVPHAHRGRFKPGYCPPVRRRVGSQNRITRDIKRGIVEAAVRIGRDGKGAGGLVGYLEWLAKKKPGCFAQLLGKLVPLQVHGDLDMAGAVLNVSIVPVPTDRFLPANKAAEDVLIPPSLPVTVVEPEQPAAVESAALIDFPANRRGDQR